MSAGRIFAAGLLLGMALSASAAQTVSPADPRLARHRASLWAEAREHLEQRLEGDAGVRWSERPAAERDRAFESPAALRALTRDLAALPTAAPGLQAADALSDRLDLAPVPGLAEAGLEQPPVVALRVWLTASWPAEGKPAAARASWIAPDGSRLRARREALNRAAFEAPGFDLFFRAPSGPAGRWWIELELEHEGDPDPRPAARVPFDLVAGLEARLEALGSGPAAQALRAELRLTQESGLRPGHGLAVEEQLAALELQLGGGDSGWWRAPFAPACLGYRPAAAQRWGLLVAEPRLSAAGRWRGRLGQRWRDWCERQGVLLIAVETSELEACLDAWAEGRDGWPTPFGGEPLLLLPGGAGLALPALLSAQPARARWTYAFEARGAAPPALALPGLVLLGPRAFAASRELPDPGGRFRRAPDSLLESELDWPLLIAGWPTAAR